MDLSVLTFLFDGIEEMEFIAPVDLLRRAGVPVTIAGIPSSGPVTGKNGVVLSPDCDFSAMQDRSFDALILSGGPGVRDLLSHSGLISCIQRHFASGALIGAICAAPLLLHTAGLLEGYSFTCHASLANELPLRDSSSPVLVDRQLITSQGAGTAHLFALQLVASLAGSSACTAISHSIALPNC